jgi:hypothetical protein
MKRKMNIVRDWNVKLCPFNKSDTILTKTGMIPRAIRKEKLYKRNKG